MVVQCIRQYIIPASQPNSGIDPLQARMILFARDMSNGQLPAVLVEPPTGLPNYFLAQPTLVPDDALVDTFYQTHRADELIPARIAVASTSQEATRYFTFIPLPWIPAFIDGLHPREALRRAREIIGLLPVAKRGQYAYIENYLRAACHKAPGANVA